MVLGTPEELKEHAELMKKFPEMEHDEPHMAHVKPGKSGEIVWQFTKAGEFQFACLHPGPLRGRHGRQGDGQMKRRTRTVCRQSQCQLSVGQDTKAQ